MSCLEAESWLIVVVAQTLHSWIRNKDPEIKSIPDNVGFSLTCLERVRLRLERETQAAGNGSLGIHSEASTCVYRMPGHTVRI